MIRIYCDGSGSSEHSKPGGYGWCIVDKNKIIDSGYGGSVSTNNNEMELLAIYYGIQAAIKLGLQNQQIEVISDSQHALGVVCGVFYPSSNEELVSDIKTLYNGFKSISFKWVKGHSGEKWNDKSDSLAKLGKLENS